MGTTLKVERRLPVLEEVGAAGGVVVAEVGFEAMQVVSLVPDKPFLLSRLQQLVEADLKRSFIL